MHAVKAPEAGTLLATPPSSAQCNQVCGEETRLNSNPRQRQHRFNTHVNNTSELGRVCLQSCKQAMIHARRLVYDNDNNNDTQTRMNLTWWTHDASQNGAKPSDPQNREMVA
jgi:hypothetical protein